MAKKSLAELAAQIIDAIKVYDVVDPTKTTGTNHRALEQNIIDSTLNIDSGTTSITDNLIAGNSANNYIQWATTLMRLLSQSGSDIGKVEVSNASIVFDITNGTDTATVTIEPDGGITIVDGKPLTDRTENELVPKVQINKNLPTQNVTINIGANSNIDLDAQNTNVRYNLAAGTGIELDLSIDTTGTIAESGVTLNLFIDNQAGAIDIILTNIASNDLCEFISQDSSDITWDTGTKTLSLSGNGLYSIIFNRIAEFNSPDYEGYIPVVHSKLS